MVILFCKDCEKFVPGTNIKEAKLVFAQVVGTPRTMLIDISQDDEQKLISDLVIGKRTCSLKRASRCGAECTIPEEFVPKPQ